MATIPESLEHENYLQKRSFATVTLIIAIIFQFLLSISRGIQQSNVRVGRISYYFSFATFVFHDIFSGILVPFSLLWVALNIIDLKQDVDMILSCAVGMFWYGPAEVQKGFLNIFMIPLRLKILNAALAPYLRPRKVLDESGNEHLVKVSRQLSFWPSYGKQCEKYWENVEHLPTIKYCQKIQNIRYDTCLRSVARIGADLAISGYFTENELRDWYVLMIANEAKFEGSALCQVEPVPFSVSEHNGFGARRMLERLKEIKEDWTEEELKKLIRVYEGARVHGIRYLQENEWLGGGKKNK